MEARPGPLLHVDAERMIGDGGLMLMAQAMVEGFTHGLHRSPNIGSSQEFSSYRGFLPGDSPQRIDWKVYGRTDDLFVREFEQETNLRGYLFLDASRSMDFGAGGGHKFHYGRLLCAVLALLLHRQQDAPGLALFGSGGTIPPEDWFPPSTRRDHLDHLIHHLETRKPDGPHDHLRGLDEMVGECHRRSIAVLVTDALIDPSELKEVLNGLRMRESKAIVFHLLAREELDPRIEGDVVLIDKETGAEQAIDGGAYRALHADHMARFRSEVERVCHDTEADYCLLPTDQPLDEALHRFLALRSGS